MNGLEDVLATSGFWLCAILLIFRGAIKERILNAPAKSSAELAEMKAKIQALESRVTLLTTELLEVREVQDFDRRLANKPERLAVPRSVTTTSGGAGKLTLPQK